MAMVMVILATYSNTFHSSFHFDDEHNIVNRPAVHLSDFSWPSIKKTFYNDKWNLYRPVACFSFAINYYFGQENVFGYHVVNVCIHFIASLFLFLFLQQLLQVPLLREKYAEKAYSIALLSAFFWATNPIQTQAVTYIVQRMASMAGMFYIMAMYFYLKGRVSNRRSTKWIFFMSCFISGAFAIGSKENAAMLPMILFLLDLFFIQGLSKKNILRAFIFIGIIIVILPLLALLIRGPKALDPSYFADDYALRNFTLPQRLLTEPRILLFYISLLFYPMPNRLCLSHDFQISYGFWNPPTTILSIVAIIAVLILAFTTAKKKPLISFCILFFFLNHVIESTIFPLELIYEHRNYLPSMMFFVLIALVFLKIHTYFSYKRSLQWVITSFVVLILVSQGHGTFMRNMTWKTGESLWIDVIEKYPTFSRGYHNLGYYYDLKGQKEKAIQFYEHALELPDPSHGRKRYITHTNLGSIFSSLGNDEKAVQHFQSAIAEIPNNRFFPDPYNNLAGVRMRQGRYREAGELIITALNHAPEKHNLHYNLGLLFLKTHRFDKAIFEFKEAQKFYKNHRASLLYLGIAHKALGQYAQATQCFMKHLIRNPKAFQDRIHLAETYLLAGKKQKGEHILHQAFSETSPRIVLSILTSAPPWTPSPEIPWLENVLAYAEGYYGKEVLTALREKKD